MYAVLRLNSFDPDKLATAADRLAEFDGVHAPPVGSVVVDLGAGRRFALNLWESEQAQRGCAARARAGGWTATRSADVGSLPVHRGRDRDLVKPDAVHGRLTPCNDTTCARPECSCARRTR
jgi:hypothetical protein